jgi:hypothetical protein
MEQKRETTKAPCVAEGCESDAQAEVVEGEGLPNLLLPALCKACAKRAEMRLAAARWGVRIGA